MRDYGSLAAVRNFHKTFYHPKNCCLIVCGDMEPTEIFGVCEFRLTSHLLHIRLDFISKSLHTGHHGIYYEFAIRSGPRPHWSSL